MKKIRFPLKKRENLTHSMKKLIPFLLLLCSCSSKYLTAEKEYVDCSTLASTFVKSPDPAQTNPPKGERIWINWNIPELYQKEKLTLIVKMIFCDYTQEIKTIPIEHLVGCCSIPILNQKYVETGGLLTYKAEIVTSNDTLISQWKHQMWFDLIEIS